MRLFGIFCVAALLQSCAVGQAQSGSEPDPAETPMSPVSAEAGAPDAAATPAPVVTPRNTYNSVNVSGRYLALTFDDGPHRTLTPKLLDVLKQKGVKATFFVVGKNVVEYPEIVRRIVREGHELGNHSWSHQALTKLSVSGIQREMERTNHAVEEAAGVKMALMRPPYGATSKMVTNLMADRYGFTSIMWSVDPLDWKYRNASRVTSELTSKAHPGAILLAHDIHASTVAAVPETIDRLRSKGYEFLTVSELLEREVPPATAAPVTAVSSASAAAVAAATPVADPEASQDVDGRTSAD